MKRLFQIIPAMAIGFFASCSSLKQNPLDAKLKTEQYLAVADHAKFRYENRNLGKKVYQNDTLLAETTPENATIKISLADQRGLLLNQGRVVMDFPIASGRGRHATPTGEYKVLGKERMHRSNLYGKYVDGTTGHVVNSDADIRTSSKPEGANFVGSPMPYWMRLTNSGIGLHVGIVPGGRPASHGCVRVLSTAMPAIYQRSKVGTPVSILDKIEIPEHQDWFEKWDQEKGNAPAASASSSSATSQKALSEKKR